MRADPLRIRSPSVRYWLLQLPGLLLFAALAAVAYSHDLIAGSTALLLGLLWLVQDLILYPIFVRSDRLHYPMGRDALIGAHAEVVTAISPTTAGQIKVHGELWQGRSVEGRTLAVGRRVEVFSVDGLTAYVKPLTSTPFSHMESVHEQPNRPQHATRD